jgi:TM2 domain-containing membrane protein YozV
LDSYSQLLQIIEVLKIMQDQQPDASKKIAAGVLGILFGAFGVHKFILGYSTEGAIALVITLVGGMFTCGLAAAVMGVIGMIEGIIYLTQSDEAFINTYILQKKGWF